MPLYTLAVVDKHGHGQPVAHAVMAREDEAHVRLFIEDIVQWETQVSASTFVTDKDFAEINAVRHVCPDASVFLCRFHIMKAFTEEINREGLDNGESLLQSCRRLLYAGSHGKYSDTLNDIKDNYPRFYRYLQKNWLPHESLFAGYARRGVLHFDNHTNNTLERYHHTIKSVTGSSQISVGLLVDRLHKLLSVRMMSWQQANFNSQMRSKPFTADVVAGYSGKVSSLRWNVYRTNITSLQTVNFAVHRMQMARYLSGITHAH